jgi:transcriptional regulator with XRE-family HTH domain
MSFGTRLKEARLKKKLTQLAAAKRIGIDDTTLSKYENDKSEPDNETLQKLAELYEVTTDYLLLGRTDNPLPGKESDLPNELNDPEFNLFFKDFLSAPEERRREMIEIWEIIKKREAGRKPEDKQGE